MSRRLSPLTTTLALLSLLASVFAGSLAPVSASAQTSQEASAMVNVTFVACPPGGDQSGPPNDCAETIDAPENAMVTAAPDRVQAVNDVERNADGSYSIPYAAFGAPGTQGMGLVNFFSPDFNYFTMDGVDTLTRWYGGVELAEGETREVTVTYWNGPDGLIMPAENELVVNVFTCDEGIDPTMDASGCAPALEDVPEMYVGTSPLREIEMTDYLVRDGGTYTYAGLPAYTQAQVVVRDPLAGYTDVLVTGQAEEIADDSATAFLLRNERRIIDVYFFAPDGSASVPPTETPEANTGTLRLTLLSCPAGVIPHDDPGRCIDPIEDDGTAMVTFPETGERVPLIDFERNEAGTYLITGIQDSVTIDGVTSLDRDRIASDADEINGPEIVYTVEPGETRDGRVYYFDD